jgi:hypothetical protein
VGSIPKLGPSGLPSARPNYHPHDPSPFHPTHNTLASLLRTPTLWAHRAAASWCFLSWMPTWWPHGSAVYLTHAAVFTAMWVCVASLIPIHYRMVPTLSAQLSLSLSRRNGCAGMRDHLDDHSGISPTNRLWWAIRTDHRAPRKPFLAILKSLCSLA